MAWMRAETWMRAVTRVRAVSWMRAAIVLGGAGTVAGVAGMLVWINDGSNYFGVAVALASAGFLTLVACVLTRVFGSSHGSQDDAFRRGRSMGYDAGWVEGRAAARPVVVPLLRAVGRNQEIFEPGFHVSDSDASHRDVSDFSHRDVSDFSHGDVGDIAVSRIGVSHSADVVELKAPPSNPLAWSPDHEYPVAQYPVVEWDRVLSWVSARRIPLMAGVLGFVLVGVVVVSAMARPSVPSVPSVPAAALGLPSGSLLHRSVPTPGETPPLVRRAGGFGTSAAVVAGTLTLASAKAGNAPIVPVVAATVAALLRSAPLGLPGDRVGASGVAVVVPATVVPVIVAPATVAPAIPSQPAVTPPVTAPLAGPVVASPVVPLTAAQQTAADALAAANLTAANAAAAASLTAANAKAAADLTAANAAAAAAATAQAAADAAWAVAHP